MSTDCHACSTSPEPAQGCKGCRALSLARLFLAKGERGKAFRRACEQLGVSVDEVQRAHEADTIAKEPAT